MNISSIIGFNKEIFKQSIYKKADGVIYTEKNEPSIIKYLKVIDNNTKDYYTLYGNSQYNSFECMDDMSCIMYGDNGGDIFMTDEYSNDYIVKDFKKYNNADQILIKGNGSNSGLSEVKAVKTMLNGKRMTQLVATCMACEDNEDISEIVNRSIFLEGFDYNYLDEWVYKTMNGTKSEKKESFIKIDQYGIGQY